MEGGFFIPINLSNVAPLAEEAAVTAALASNGVSSAVLEGLRRTGSLFVREGHHSVIVGFLFAIAATLRVGSASQVWIAGPPPSQF